MNTYWNRWVLLGLATASLGCAVIHANDIQVQSYIVHTDSYQISHQGNEK